MDFEYTKRYTVFDEPLPLTDLKTDNFYATQSIGIGETSSTYELNVLGDARVTGILSAANVVIDYVDAKTASIGIATIGTASIGSLGITTATIETAGISTANIGIASVGIATVGILTANTITINDGLIRNNEYIGHSNMTSGLAWKRYSHTVVVHPVNTEELTTLIKGATFVAEGTTPNITAFSFSVESYAVEFIGYFYAETTGVYNFGVNSDDASDLFIDGKLVAYWYGGHGANASGTPGGTQLSIYLTKGFHRLYTRYEEIGGGDSHEILYQTPGSLVWTVIPSTVLFYDSNDLSPGTVLQTVHFTTRQYQAIGTGTLQNTPLTATITPKSSTSKILVMVNLAAAVYTYEPSGTSAYLYWGMAVTRNGTPIYYPHVRDFAASPGGPERPYGLALELFTPTVATGINAGMYGNYPFQFVDTPATISPLTYVVQAGTYSVNNGDIYINPWNYGDDRDSKSSITLMELR